MDPMSGHQWIDHAALAQEAAEKHLDACWAVLNDQGGPTVDTDQDPFCGCMTCEIREVLHAAVPHLAAMWAQDGATAGAATDGAHPEAANIEIIERTNIADPLVIIPNEIRINGHAVLYPAR